MTSVLPRHRRIGCHPSGAPLKGEVDEQRRFHLCFQAQDEDTVRRFHAAAVAAGGRDHGAPGERAQYHPGYYGAFVRDADGNNVEAVHHGFPSS